MEHVKLCDKTDDAIESRTDPCNNILDVVVTMAGIEISFIGVLFRLVACENYPGQLSSGQSSECVSGEY